MAEAIILTEETLNAVVDKVRGHSKEHGELGELSYWTYHYHWALAKAQWKTLISGKKLAGLKTFWKKNILTIFDKKYFQELLPKNIYKSLDSNFQK